MSRKDRKNAQYPTDADAKFIGYQKTSRGYAMPLYNITLREHPLYGSTVTEDTLQKYKLRIPPDPPKTGI